jgi:hypothetical protein
VKFYASLGNHDVQGQTQYKLFNMDGKKYYSFKPRNGVRFFAIDSNYVDAKQLEWLDKELAASGSDRKIAFFRHDTLNVPTYERPHCQRETQSRFQADTCISSRPAPACCQLVILGSPIVL